MEMAVEVSGVFAKEKYEHVYRFFPLYSSSARLCPIFQLSNVTGAGLDFVSIIMPISVLWLVLTRGRRSCVHS